MLQTFATQPASAYAVQLLPCPGLQQSELATHANGDPLPVRQLHSHLPLEVRQYLLQQSSSRLQLVPTVEQLPAELLLEPLELLAEPLELALLLATELEPLLVLLVEPTLVLLLAAVVVVELLAAVLLVAVLLLAALLLWVVLLLAAPLDEPPMVRQPIPASVCVQVAPEQQSPATLQGQGGEPVPPLHLQTFAPPSSLEQ